MPPIGGGLMQLVAYGAQDVYLSNSPQITFFRTTYRRHTNFAMDGIEIEYGTCNSTMSFRKYENFDIIFDDTKIGKELYYASELIHIFSINLYDLNCNPILVNSKQIIQQDKLKLETLLNKEKKEKREREIEEEKERKKEERRNRNGGVQFFKYAYGLSNGNARAQRAAQNRQIKNQIKNQMRRR